MRTIEPGIQCALYCVYAAACSLDRSVPIDHLLRGRYLSSEHGSTARDLIQALADVGLEGHFVMGLDTSTLCHATRPVILQCQLSRKAEQSFHWVTFLGDNGGLAEIYDAPREVESMPYAQLQTTWTGNAIVVGDARYAHELQFESRLRAATWLWVPALFCVGVLMWSKCHSARARSSRIVQRHLAQVTCVFVLTGIWGLATILMDSNHPVANHEITEFLGCAQALTQPIHVAAVPLDSIIVDCRLPLAFGLGHIDGAINIPIDATFSEWESALPRLTRDKQIIVYCQSEKCAWADRMASRLVCHGFRAAVLEGGFETFQKKMSRRDEPACSTSITHADPKQTAIPAQESNGDQLQTCGRWQTQFVF